MPRRLRPCTTRGMSASRSIRTAKDWELPRPSSRDAGPDCSGPLGTCAICLAKVGVAGSNPVVRSRSGVSPAVEPADPGRVAVVEEQRLAVSIVAISAIWSSSA